MKRPVDIISNNKNSLVHIGSLDSFDLTKGGIEAAANILRFFETQDKSYLEESIKAYDKLIPTENFGGEYTALRWICRLLLAPSPEHYPDEIKIQVSDPAVASWYEYLKDNNFEKLREYINNKYHLAPNDHDSDAGRETALTLRFLEDFILFSNPDRELWEKTEKILRKLRIVKGSTVADVGCGSGYFTFKFADMVGPGGKIYGIETNPMHLDYLRGYIKKNAIKNVEIIEGSNDGIRLDPTVRVDIVFSCSLFHVLYAVFSEEDRRLFIESIANTLKPGGALIVVDNDLVEGDNLPYHGPYIAKDLLISQLHHYGFKLVKKVQETKQRYALVFKKRDAKPAKPDKDKTDLGKGVITDLTGISLVKHTLADTNPIFLFTENGKCAAELFLRALEDKTRESIDAAIDAYEKIIPVERIGDDYTALVWFCEYLKSDDQTRAAMISDPLAKEFHEFFADNDYALLKSYFSKRRYLTEHNAPVQSEEGASERDPENAPGVSDLDDLMNLSEYMAFNNPARERWEKTSQMLDFIDVKPGETIADIGCGSGYFTYKFANLVGSAGQVYSTEINKTALAYVESMRDRYALRIEPVVGALNDANLPHGRFDKVFMCSMYHAVYVASIEFVKDAFIESIKKAMKDDGKLIIVDNDIKREGVPEYYGAAIDKRLIVSQLMYYGFKLVDERQFVPQRYVLVFQKQ